MRIKLGVPEQLTDQERREALDAALEASTRAITPLVRRGAVPTAATAIKRHGVRWRPEPPGDEEFALPGDVLSRKWGDCDDLAPYHAASLRATGADSGARAFVKKSGPNRWHALVQRSDGTIEDPSRAAGMGAGVNGHHQVWGAGPPMWAPMFADRMAMAVYPLADGRTAARVDVPDLDLGWSWSGLHSARNVPTAVVGAMRCARLVTGDGIDELDELRLSAIEDLVMGTDPDEVYEALSQVCGTDLAGDVMEDATVVGSFFDKLTSLAKGTPAGAIIDLARGRTPAPVQAALPGRPGMMPSGGGDMPLFQAKQFLAENPQLAPLVQQLMPLASMAAVPFLGPLAPMAGGMLSQFLVPPGGGAPQGGGMIPPGMLSQLLMPGASQMAPQVPMPQGMVPGMTMQPGGAGSPMFLRF